MKEEKIEIYSAQSQWETLQNELGITIAKKDNKKAVMKSMHTLPPREQSIENKLTEVILFRL